MNSDISILVIAEQNDNKIHRVSYELVGKATELSKNVNSTVEALVLGGDINSKELCYRGAHKVYHMKSEIFDELEENLYKENIVKFIKDKKPDIVLIGATNFGRSLAPRIAGVLKTGLTADCTDLIFDEDNNLIQIRPAFSDNILAHIKTVTRPQMATIRYKEFAEPKRDINRKVGVEVIDPYIDNYPKTEIAKVFKEDNFNITDAEVVVAAGRGIKRAEDLKLIGELAEALGGSLGVSRPLVDMGMVSSSHQVGYSGNRVKPMIYIACGISGAPQHIAGMKESDLIIAINSDPSAPIFNIADIGYVGDLYEIIPKILEELTSYAGGSHGN